MKSTDTINYQSLPKVELHVHLDCCLSYEVVKIIDPSVSLEEYQTSFIAPPKCTDLADYITRAVKGFELMQTKEELALVTNDLFRQLKQDNVIYAEIRFAPLQHLQKGLSPTEVIEVITTATNECTQRYGIEAGIILCTLRHYTEEQSMQTVQLVQQFRTSGVVGFDIAADEAGFPIDNHISAFSYAQAQKIPCTAHAGEACGPKSVWETLEHFHPSRIGHGVRSAEDTALLQHLKNHNIHLEVCPTSNVQTNVFSTIRQHTADMIYKNGVSMSINTDARTISNVSLTDEYQSMESHFGWTKQHFYQCNLEAIEHSFASVAIKEKIRTRLIETWS